MHSLVNDLAAGLFSGVRPPCLSLYQPTHRQHPDNRQDPIRFRNLVDVLEASLRHATARGDLGQWRQPFDALAADHDFWNHALDGLAVLAAGDVFRVYRLQRPVRELAIVADSFHTKPLLRFLQSADRYQVLGVSRGRIRLLEGTRDVLDEIEPAPDVVQALADARGDEPSERHLAVRSGPGKAAIYHGHGGGKGELDKDAERLFRALDRAVLEHHSRPSGLPLVLVALDEDQGRFRSVSKNPFLLGKGVATHPDAITVDDLRVRVWEAVEPRYLGQLATLVEEFGTARAAGRAADEPLRIAEAATAGRVATLMIDADREIPGRFDVSAGTIAPADLADPNIDDVLDDLAERVLETGGHVVVVPGGQMPTRTGAAAIYRF